MLVSYANIQQLLPSIIKGRVLAHTGFPVSGAQVYFVPRIEETVTNAEGNFSLTTWNALPLTLIVCHCNYESYKVTLTDASKELLIKLKEK